MEKFDLVVLGSGPAGYSAAIRACDYGKHVCIVEKKHIGGAGVMHGVLTSKTMWELSRDYNVAASVNLGFRASGLHVDFAQVKKSIIQAAKEKQYQMLSQIESLSKSISRNGSLSLKYGHGRFLDRDTIEIEHKGKKEKIQGKDFIIATGSRPREYPGIETDQVKIINSDGILNLKKFPERMMIIGSGIIGCEFATIFSNYKQTEVHLLDRQHRVIPFEDNDLSDFVSKSLTDNGVKIHHTANLRTIKRDGENLQVFLDYKDGHARVIEVDVVLISIGRVPNTDDIGLENVGIVPNRRGFLHINDFCMIKDNPNKCHIFAAGDITGHAQLYNVAENQGRYAARSIYKNQSYLADYSSMSTLMFFKPEVAAVGMNERQLKRKGIPYKAAFYSNEMVNRAIAMRNINGFIKIMVSDDEEGKILGMRAAGPQASAFIISIAHLLNKKNGLYEALKIIHPHPSVTEGIRECLRLFEEKSLFKPFAFPDGIKLTRWKPE